MLKFTSVSGSDFRATTADITHMVTIIRTGTITDPTIAAITIVTITGQAGGVITAIIPTTITGINFMGLRPNKLARHAFEPA
jgi:hypothetical protein